MLTGAALFVRAYPALKPMIEAGDHGKVTLARPGRSPWPWVIAMGSTVALASLSDLRPKVRGPFALRASFAR